MSGPEPRREERWAIRAPNHLGEAVLALPALERAVALSPARPVVQVVRPLAPVLEMAGIEAEILPLENRHRLFRAARRLRSRTSGRGILLTPSLSAALIFWLARLPERRGTATDGRSLLLTEPVDREPLLAGHRVWEYLHLMDPGGAGAGKAAEGEAPAESGEGRAPPRPRLRRLDRARTAWEGLAARAGVEAEGGRETVGIVPGGNAPSRRWPAERHAELASRLAERGVRVLVFGGPGDRRVTERVSRSHAGAVDLGGRTDLWSLAGGLAACHAVVANDTGPMHMASALGRPLVVPWGAGDMRQTRPAGGRVELVAHHDLPCAPCVKNRCPRRGEGFRLPEARLECLRLVRVDEVLEGLASLGALDSLRRSGGADGRSREAGRAPFGERPGEGPVERGEGHER